MDVRSIVCPSSCLKWVTLHYIAMEIWWILAHTEFSGSVTQKSTMLRDSDTQDISVSCHIESLFFKPSCLAQMKCQPFTAVIKGNQAETNGSAQFDSLDSSLFHTFRNKFNSYLQRMTPEIWLMHIWINKQTHTETCDRVDFKSQWIELERVRNEKDPFTTLHVRNMTLTLLGQMCGLQWSASQWQVPWFEGNKISEHPILLCMTVM